MVSFDEDKKKVCFQAVDKLRPTFVRLKVYIECPTSDARLSGAPAESFERNRMIAIRLPNAIETQSNITQDLLFDC